MLINERGQDTSLQYHGPTSDEQNSYRSSQADVHHHSIPHPPTIPIEYNVLDRSNYMCTRASIDDQRPE